MAGSTNFIQFNPTQSNQETDAAYATDALVTGGVQLNNPLPSVFLNKLWYQVSTFVAAFANMMVSKGYSPTDTSISALSTVLANVLTNADTQPQGIVVTYSPTAVFDRSLAKNFQITLTGNCAPTVINAAPFDEMTFIIITNGTAGHTYTWPSNCINFGDMVSTPMNANTTYIQKGVARADGTIYSLSALQQNP